MAVIEWVATVNVEVFNVALPDESVPVPRVVAPSLKVTVPVGVPVPPVLVTVAVNVTDWLNTEGFAFEATVVVVAVSATAGIESSQTPRPCVPANSRRFDSCNPSASTATFGSPVTKVDHVVPPSLVFITPTSVPIYRVLAMSGSKTMAFTGMLGRLPLMLVHVVPEFVD